jgi:hypothetical protein
MQYDLRIIREALMPKGYNDKVPPEFVPAGYLADAQNATITDESVDKRKGYSVFGNDTGEKRILGLQGVTTSDGIKRMFKFNNKIDNTAIQIYETTGDNIWNIRNENLLLGAGNPVNSVVARNKVICFDGNSHPVIITPGSPSTIAAATDANFPHGSFAIWFHNFLFVAGVASYPNRLYWSDLDDPTDFSTGVTGYIDINENDGDEIIGLNILKDELLVFKRNRIWSLTGFGTTTFTVADINENISGFGAVSHRGIVNIGNDVIYMSSVGGEPEFRSVNRTKYGTIVEGGTISDDITNSMKKLEKTQLQNVVGEFDGRRVYMACPSSGGTINDKVFVYDTVNKGFVRWTGLYPSCFAKMDFSGEIQIYFGESREDSKVYVMDESDSDNGAPIDFYVITRRYGGDKPERKKKWKYCYVTAEKLGNYDLNVYQSPDGFTYEPLDRVNLSPVGTTFPITFDEAPLGVSDTIRKRMDFAKKTSYYLQLKFWNDEADEPIRIRHWELLYKERALRDAKP